ncbi:MAG: carbonic anhydrase [Oligoflexia bacterium]|nr:carbonic anhydrase [Oligoflexia bacterium]
MKKLVKGIVEFRKKRLPDYIEKFAHLALGQAPDTLFIACSDSRVVPNLFASTDPGDLFVIRNVGNMIPPCGKKGLSTADESEAAAIEFALLNLNIKDIIICGHSECGAMQALLAGREISKAPNLSSWLRHGQAGIEKIKEKTHPQAHNHLSKENVLNQIENIKTYPVVQKKISEGKLKIHGWWFELSTANVYAYEEQAKDFVLIDEAQAEKILERISGK